MLQYEVKPATHVSLVTGWLLTIGGIIGLVLPILPGLPFLLLGLAILSNGKRSHKAMTSSARQAGHFA
jgi:uncharacterized membrane protein YbaN (DUF454 family)